MEILTPCPDRLGLKEVTSLHFGSIRQYGYGVSVASVTEADRGSSHTQLDDGNYNDDSPILPFGGARNPNNVVYVFDASFCFIKRSAFSNATACDACDIFPRTENSKPILFNFSSRAFERMRGSPFSIFLCAARCRKTQELIGWFFLYILGTLVERDRITLKIENHLTLTSPGHKIRQER